MSSLAGKAVLFVGAGVEAVAGIRQAQELGLFVVASDWNPDAPGMKIADDRIVASTYDVEETVRAARGFHLEGRTLHGVLCLATDVPLTVASVAADLGLPGIPVEVAARAMDKLVMKDKFAADSVAIPWYAAVESADHLREIVEQKGADLVLKPADSRGGRGVQRLAATEDLSQAFATAHQHSPTGRVMVEQFLPGPQVSTESLVVDGVAHTLGFSDRNYEFLERYAPHFIENGGDMPSHLPPEAQQAIRELVQQAAASLGVENGVVKGDMVFSEGKAYVIEMAARLSGGYFCTHQIPLQTGVDLVEQAIRVALGEKPPATVLSPTKNQAVTQRYLFPEPGRVVSVSGVEEARSMLGVEEVWITVEPDDLIGSPTDSNASAGMVIAVADAQPEAQQRALKAVEKVRIETEAL